MRILLVEDEHRISAYVKRGLEQSGYAVDAVFTGRDALDWAEVAPSDLIILDIMLPIIDGLTVCRELRQRGDAFLTGVKPLFELPAELRDQRALENDLPFGQRVQVPLTQHCETESRSRQTDHLRGAGRHHRRGLRGNANLTPGGRGKTDQQRGTHDRATDGEPPVTDSHELHRSLLQRKVRLQGRPCSDDDLIVT